MPPLAVVVQTQAGLFALAGVAIGGGGFSEDNVVLAPGAMAHFARFRGAVDGVGLAAQVVTQQLGDFY